MARHCCALRPCDDPDCYFCVVMPKKFPPVVRCAGTVAVGTERKPRTVRCRYIAQHPGPCRPSRQSVDPDVPEEERWWMDESLLP